MIGLLAGVLLLVRIIVVLKLYKVLKIQINLLKRPIDPDVWEFRQRLHYMTLTLMAGNILPIVLDFLVVLHEVGAIDHYRTSFVLALYAISNATTVLIAVIMIKRMYDLANQTKDVDDLEKAYIKKRG